MAESGVNIKITTTANTAGAAAATKSLDALETEVKQLTQQMRQLAVDSDAFNETRTRLASLNTEITSLKTGKDAAAGSARNFGQAMLQGSRGVQDFAAAGIPGMVNNVEGLASALGLGASAAGGFTLAFVGIELLMRNWGSIQAAFGGPEKAKAFWAAMTPDESIAKRLNDIATAQERLADSYQRTADARKAALDSQQTELDWMEKRKKLWEGMVKTPEQRGVLPPLPGTEKASPELTKAAINQAQAESQSAAALNTFKASDKAVTDQQARVDAINKISSFDERLKLANAKDDEAIKGLNLRTNQSGQPESPGDYQKLDEIRASKQARADQMRAKITAVPGLQDGMTGDPEKDSEQLAKRAAEARAELQRLERVRYERAQQAEAANTAQQQASDAVKGQAAFDQDARLKNSYKQTGEEPLPGVSASADALAGFAPLVQQQGSQTAAAMQQAKDAFIGGLQQVQTAATQMEQGLISTLGTYAQKLSSITSSLGGLENEVKTIRENSVR